MLNSQQEYLVECLLKFLDNPNERFFTVKGFAGTGKTFSIQRFLKLLPQNKYRVCVTAPTNKAVSVLTQFGADMGLYIPSKTTYSLLGLALDSSTENRTCKRVSMGKLNHYDLVIIDECSMVGAHLAEILISAVMRNQKVIFMGDPYQLNPVGEEVSNTFNVPLQALLDQPMRQSEGAILNLIRDVRQQCIDGTPPPFANAEQDDNGDGLHICANNGLTDLAASQFSLSTLELDIVENRFLAWRNSTVDAFNNKVRTRLHGKNPDAYIEGETISVLNPVYDHSADSEQDSELLFYTDEEVLITKIEEGFLTDIGDPKQRKYPIWRLHVIGKTHMGVIVVRHKKSNGLYHRRLNELASEARTLNSWVKFWQFKELFTEVKHVYGMTVHKSQGSTIPNTFLDADDLFYNENKAELNRLIYVGTSRASQNLIINRKVLSTH